MERRLKKLLPHGRFDDVDAARSRMMRGNRGRNTRPELLVRSCLHRMGYRFRLHREDLPGTPDIVLPRYCLAIFVHGCYWHRHGCRDGTRTPAIRTTFWKAKFARNVQRDSESQARLREIGWTVRTVWECETKEPCKLEERLMGLLKHCDA